MDFNFIIWLKFKYNLILATISAFIRVNLRSETRSHPQGWLPHCRLTGCGGREKCREAGQRDIGGKPPHTTPQPTFSACAPAPGPHSIGRAPGIIVYLIPSCHHHKRNPQQCTRHPEPWQPLGRGLFSG